MEGREEKETNMSAPRPPGLNVDADVYAAPASTADVNGGLPGREWGDLGGEMFGVSGQVSYGGRVYASLPALTGPAGRRPRGMFQAVSADAQKRPVERFEVSAGRWVAQG